MIKEKVYFKEGYMLQELIEYCCIIDRNFRCFDNVMNIDLGMYDFGFKIVYVIWSNIVYCNIRYNIYDYFKIIFRYDSY